MIEKLIQLQKSINSYSEIFSRIGRTPPRQTAEQLAEELEPLETFIREMGHRVKFTDPGMANSIWLVASYINCSDIRPMLSVFILRVEKQLEEPEFEQIMKFERMRFRLADQLVELAEQIDELVESESVRKNVQPD